MSDGFSNALLVVELAITEVHFDGFAKHCMSAFNQGESFMSFARSHLMIEVVQASMDAPSHDLPSSVTRIFGARSVEATSSQEP